MSPACQKKCFVHLWHNRVSVRHSTWGRWQIPPPPRDRFRMGILNLRAYKYNQPPAPKKILSPPLADTIYWTVLVFMKSTHVYAEQTEPGPSSSGGFRYSCPYYPNTGWGPSGRGLLSIGLLRNIRSNLKTGMGYMRGSRKIGLYGSRESPM